MNVGSMFLYSFRDISWEKSGDDGYVDPPVPIPNTVVKHINAESTWLETAWEDRKLPVKREDTLMGVFF